MILPLTLETGLRLFRPKYQPILIEETNRVIEQASAIACLHLKQPASCAPSNILEFCNSIEPRIKSRTDNLFNLLPTTSHLVEDFDESEPRQVEDIEPNNRWPSLNGRIERLRRKVSDLRYTIRPASKSSGTSDIAKYSHRPSSHTSKSSTKQSSGSKKYSSSLSPFSHDNSHDSAHSLPDTITSNPQSEVTDPSMRPRYPNSTQT